MKWRDNPAWLNGLLGGVIGGFIGAFGVDLLEQYFAWRIGFLAFLLIAFGNIIWTQTRKNAFFYQRDQDFMLKIAGKKLEINLKFLSEVWIENQELHIRRINRVDSFPVAHLREEDVEKLMGILKEYEPQVAA